MTRAATTRLTAGLTIFAAGLLAGIPALAAEPCLHAAVSHSGEAERACSDLIAGLRYEGAAAGSDPQAAVALASAYNNRALARLDAGNLEGAAADLGEAITLTPSSWAIYLNRGNLQLTSGNPQAALADYERVLELAPDQAAAVSRNSALAWRALGNPAAAEQLLLRAARQNNAQDATRPPGAGQAPQPAASASG